MSKYKEEIIKSEKELFGKVKNSFLDYDPAYYVENNLTIDGEPFKLIGNGWRFMADIYRYIALQATTETGRPVVICKGRQIGATMMAGALDLYLTNSGLFSNPPIRVLHAFPTLAMVKKFTQDKLEGMVRTAKDDLINKNKLKSANAVDNLTMKQFNTGTLWVDSIGRDGDRIRGMTCDVSFFDECFPYNQCIEIEGGKIEIGKLYDLYSNNLEMPKVKSFNESTGKFEYQKVTNAWCRGLKEVIEIHADRRIIKCTPNHKFLTISGTISEWKEAADLSSEDLLISGHNNSQMAKDPNIDQRQLILGSFLGDGHISEYANKKFRLSVIHSMKQKDYCKWKADALSANCSIIPKNGYIGSEAIKFCTKGISNLGIFPKTKSTCPQWILDELDLKGIAIWFMDNGSVQKWNNEESDYACISTNSFDEDSQKRFVEVFKKFDINCFYKKYDYFSLYFKKSEFEKLSKLISPYFHESMEYKLLKQDRKNNKYFWDFSFKEHVITGIQKIVKNNEKLKVYDIGVLKNHNFIITSSGRNKNLGGPVVHNCQDMYGSAIGNTTKILTQAKYGSTGKGVQVYFGTPKERSSFFHSIWEMSDKRYYHLGCKNCGKNFPFYMSGDNGWMDVWIDSFNIKCPLCGFIQHKVEAVERGKWVSSVANPEACKYVGFHINQLYLPNFSKQHISDLMPENNPTQSTRVWNNEVIGEFYSGAGLPLTKADIYENCRDPERYLSKKIDPHEKKTYLGVDWGGKIDNDNIDRGQSYSCVVVLSAQSDGTLLVEHAHKIGEHTFQHKIATIKECYRRFGIQRGISDWFYGNDVVNDLQSIYKDKFLGAQGSGNLLNPIKFREDELMITYNKDLIIDEIFDKFRKGKIRFPWKSYEHIEWLIDHCTSMEAGVRTSGGQQIKIYEKGNIPNDGLMALMYAYMAWKFDATRGYSMKPGMQKELSMPLPSLAHIPRLK